VSSCARYGATRFVCGPESIIQLPATKSMKDYATLRPDRVLAVNMQAASVVRTGF
jgi:hypothetical protein